VREKKPKIKEPPVHDITEKPDVSCCFHQGSHGHACTSLSKQPTPQVVY
jgi:hypothetical protein